MNDIPAFPRPHSGATQYAQEGMTLRDYFAAAALVGVETITNKKDLANYCYQVADEMMKARDNNG
jgi:hypothetical protein